MTQFATAAETAQFIEHGRQVIDAEIAFIAHFAPKDREISRSEAVLEATRSLIQAVIGAAQAEGPDVLGKAIFGIGYAFGQQTALADSDDCCVLINLLNSGLQTGASMTAAALQPKGHA